MTPNFIDKILKSDWLWHGSRLLITFMYWYAGIGFALDFQGAQLAMASAGIQPLWVVAALTILVEIGGSLLIIFDRMVWLGAGALGVFTILTIPLVHHFWTMTGMQALQARLESEEHLTVIGGLVAVSVLSVVRREWMRQSENWPVATVSIEQMALRTR
ncbi:MAG: DoxX family protein [Devosia sp.]